MAKVVAELVVDGQQVFLRQMDDAEKAVAGIGDGAEQSSRKLGGMVSAMGALGGALATRELAQWGRDAADYAIQLEAMSQKADTVFGSAVSSIRGFSEENASRMGLAEDALTGLAAGYGDLLVPMGFQRDEAARMTEQTLELAGALGEWSPQLGGAQHALEALGAAMTGEREQLKAYGIVIDEAAVKAELAARGQADLTGEAERQAVAMATLDLALRGSTDAQRAFAEGGNPAVVAANEAKASYEQMRAELGQNLIPIMSTVNGLLADVTGFFGGLPEPVQTTGLALAGIGAAAVPIASTVRAAKDLGISFDGLDRSGKLLRTGGLAAAALAVGVLTTRLADARAAADTFAGSFVQGLGTEDPHAQLRALREEAERLGAIATEGFDVEAFGVRIVGDQNRKDAFDQLDAINRQIVEIEAAMAGAEAAGSGLTREYVDMSYAAWGTAEAMQAQATVANHELFRAHEHAAQHALAVHIQAQQDLARETHMATQSLQDQMDAQRAAVDPVFAVADANRGLTEAQQRLADLQADSKTPAADIAAAQQAVALAALEAQGALVDLNDAQASGATSTEQLRDSLQLLVDQGLLPAGVLEALTGQFGALADEARRSAEAILESSIAAGTYGYADSFVRQAVRGSGGGIIEDLTGTGTLADLTATATPVLVETGSTPVVVDGGSTSTRSVTWNGDVVVNVGGSSATAGQIGHEVRDTVRDALLDLLRDEAARP